jgi:hypothetical protein
MIFTILSASLAQIRVGVSGTANSTSFSGDVPLGGTYSSKAGYGFGASLDYHIAPDIVLNLQPMFNDKSTIILYNVSYQYEKFDSFKINVDYFELPLAVKIIADNYFTYVTAGISLNIPVSASLKDLRNEEKEDIKEDLNDWSLSANFGVGIQFHIGAPIMFVELRYSQGITNLTKDALAENLIEEKIKSNSLYLFAGLLFTL